MAWVLLGCMLLLMFVYTLGVADAESSLGNAPASREGQPLTCREPFCSALGERLVDRTPRTYFLNDARWKLVPGDRHPIYKTLRVCARACARVQSRRCHPISSASINASLDLASLARLFGISFGIMSLVAEERTTM